MARKFGFHPSSESIPEDQGPVMGTGDDGAVVGAEARARPVGYYHVIRIGEGLEHAVHPPVDNLDLIVPVLAERGRDYIQY